MSNRGPFQAHQNKYAFRHNKNSKKTAKILALPNFGVCKRCHDIIEWRKKYRKYKPIKDPAKCADCGGRSVLYAYHTICSECAVKRGGVCPKCCKQEELVEEGAQMTEDGDGEEGGGGAVSESLVDELNGLPLKERQRRTLQRMLDKDGVTEAEIRETVKRFQAEDKIMMIKKGKDPVSATASAGVAQDGDGEDESGAQGEQHTILQLKAKQEKKQETKQEEEDEEEDEDDDGEFDDDEDFDDDEEDEN
jgi:hypothetical protein